MSAPTVNSDLGESLGLHSFGNDELLMPLIDVANVAGGFHAGDPHTLRRTVELTLANNLAVGAHPGLPDLVGFGRREMKLTAQEVEDLVQYQVGALVGFLHAAGGRLNHIKPHGSLYGMVARDPDLMAAVVRVAQRYDAAIYGMAGTNHERVAVAMSSEFVGELYVDLNYRADGSLIIARQPPPTDPVAAAERVRHALATGTVIADDGSMIPMTFGSVCVHSDTPNAVEVAQAVRAELSTAA